jgi:hypothetical protein
MEPDLGHPIPDHPLPPLIVKERGKDMGTFDKVPSTGGKSYYNKQERDWWQQAKLPEKLDYDYSEMESTFMERKTPGGVKNTSAPASEENSGPLSFQTLSLLAGATVRMFGTLTSAPPL